MQKQARGKYWTVWSNASQNEIAFSDAARQKNAMHGRMPRRLDQTSIWWNFQTCELLKDDNDIFHCDHQSSLFCSGNSYVAPTVSLLILERRIPLLCLGIVCPI